ncbi:MAG: hypothetical protein ACXWIT_08200 [Burkholderiales bacterium]
MLTQHATHRKQQRGIPPAIINWLQEFGAIEHALAARKRFFDKRARKRLSQAIGHEVVDRLGDLMNCYLVEGLDGTIITVGHRSQRIHRH